ncbi:MAG: hypothetical protein M1836_000724 [Candelina mexicana]|nr:MAG: hypothetical protein M1836_000724 [Candelina mexicana]
MAHLDRGVYPNGEGEFSDPATAQHNFQNQYDLDNPMEAMNSYARIMHQHTKRQMENATRPVRRRSPASIEKQVTLSTESSIASVSSTSS